MLAEVFELRPHFEWRGLGFISQSALELSIEYAEFEPRRGTRSRACASRIPRRASAARCSKA